MAVTIVTGSSRGIGESVSRQLITAGKKVVGFSRSKECALYKEYSGDQSSDKYHHVLGDMGNEEDLKRLVSTAERLGGIDCLVLNAAVLGPYEKVIKQVDLKEFRRTMDTNVYGQLKLVQLALPSLAKHNGNVIGLGTSAIDYAVPGSSAYTCSKAAFEALLRVLAHEEGDVNFVILDPGLAQTAMLDEFSAGAQKHVKDTPYSDAPLPPDVSAASVVKLCHADLKGLSGSRYVYDALPALKQKP